MKSNTDARPLAMPLTARWRVVGWILLTAALMVLALILTVRSIFIRQVDLDANAAVVQELHEFNAFAREAVDPRTHGPFDSLTALMERYMERQTPDRGEAFIGVTPDEVLLLDNASNDAGERLAANPKRLKALLASPQSSGIESTPDGLMRWGKSVIQGHGKRGVLLVTQFVQANVDSVHRNMLVLFGVSLAGMVLTAFIAWLVAGQILAPVRRFARLSERIGPLDLHTRLPEHGSSELTRLARAINGMLDRLESSYREQSHVLYEVQQQLQGQLQALVPLHRRLAHDPAQVALLDGPTGEMRRLVQDLDLLLESGRPGFLHCHPVRLDDLIQQLVRQQRNLRPDRDWQVVETVDAEAELDMQRVLLALHYLANNAADNTQVGDRIGLGASVRRQADGEAMASLWVVNQGVPLSQEQARAVFEPVPHRRDALDEGHLRMGMGLAVVKALAHAHDGYAWVESGTERGTVFGIDVPMARPAEGAGQTLVQESAIQAMQNEK